jgi:hypothetical protein
MKEPAETVEKDRNAPSNWDEAREQIKELFSEEAKGETETEALPTAEGEKEKKPCETCPDEKGQVEAKEQGAEEAQVPHLWIIDEAGMKVPAIFKADGKVYVPDHPEQISTWIGHGIHSSTRNADLNRREKELNEAAAVVNMLKKAYEEGRLVVKDAPPGKGQPSAKEEVEPEPEEEEDILTDPVILKERMARKSLEKKLEEIASKLEKTSAESEEFKKAYLKEKIAVVYNELKKDMESHAKKYPLAVTTKNEKRVWELLAEKDEQGQLVYPDVESAMKAVHEEEIKAFRQYVKENPDLVKEEKDKIITKFLEDQKAKNEAPVASPSGAPAGSGPTSEFGEIKGMKDAIPIMKKFLAETKSAGEKI